MKVYIFMIEIIAIRARCGGMNQEYGYVSGNSI
jgi:hypothetical protein